MGDAPIPTGWLATEPAWTMGVAVALVGAVLTLLISFGSLTTTQKEAIMGVLTALGPIVGAILTRSRVSSPATVAQTAAINRKIMGGPTA